MENKITHLPKKFDLTKKAKKFPLLVLVVAASPCNARCPHCPATKLVKIRKTEKPFLTLRYFKKIIDECSKFDAHIRISGYGEPLLSPYIMDAIEYAKLKNAKFSIITNGSLLDEEKIKRILEAEIDAIEISVDSHRKEIYSKIRVGLDFDRVKRNILNLVKLRNKLKKKTVIMASIINQPSRNPDIEGAQKYWSKIVDKVMIRTYVTWGVLPTKDYGKPYLDPRNRPPCPYPFERLMIDPTGYVRLCPYDDQQLIPSFGHLSRQSIQEIWLGERFTKIRKNHLARKFDKIELCNKCIDFAYRSWTYNYRRALEDTRRKKKAQKLKPNPIL
jgi:MoaA/NifB/PqqE/SkfB family radical SAM enzyme